jgi:hypothetical protein
MNRGRAFTSTEITVLLTSLDERLRARSASASVFIVGGAAIAMTAGRHTRRTEDIDAVTHDEVVLAEALVLAHEDGLPENWLNTSATMWMPPLPSDAFTPPPAPGLRVTVASDEFLLATKLIAQRRKDASDIRELATRIGLADASPEDLEALIYRYYTDLGQLEFIIDGTDVPGEIRILAEQAARMLNRRG